MKKLLDWRWWILYLVPLVPVYLLDNWLLARNRVWFYVVWAVAILTASMTADRLKRYWPKRAPKQ